MTELETLRAFGADVAGPSSLARSAALSRLRAAIAAEAATAAPRGNTNTTRGPLGRRLLVPAGAIGIALAIVLPLAAVLTGAPGTLEQARAALRPDGRILHVVVRIVDGDVSTIGESWVAADGSSGRSIERSGGSVSECVSSETRLRCFDRKRNVIDVYRYNPEAIAKGKDASEIPQFRIDRPESMSQALESGYARLIGETEIAGRPVYAVLLAVPRFNEQGNASPRFLEGMSPTLFIDRETSYPVAERFPDAGSTTYYDTFEFLPATSERRSLLQLDAPADANVVVHPVGEGPPS